VLGEQVRRDEAAVGLELALGDDARFLAEQVWDDAGEDDRRGRLPIGDDEGA